MWRKTITGILVFTFMSVLAGGTHHPAKAAGGEQCTAEQGQFFIEEGRYRDAIRIFSCVIDAKPTEVEGYRGRSEAELLLGLYSDAFADYSRIIAVVQPTHPNVEKNIFNYYSDRLSSAPRSIPALTGASFARWVFYDYANAIHLLNRLLELQPDDIYGNLFRGSSRLLKGATKEKGIADLEHAIALAPESPDVRYIVADTYTYGLSDPQRAFAEASLALDWGLDTPRVHAIQASAYLAFGDELSAADHIQQHIDFVTTEFVETPPLGPGTTYKLGLVPGRTYVIPLAVSADEIVSLATSSKDFFDTVLVVLAPDSTPILGRDDTNFTLLHSTGSPRLLERISSRSPRLRA